VHCSQRAQHLCEVEGLLVHFLCSGANDCSIVAAAAAAVVSAAVSAVIVIGMISEVR
jgi:predicted regulator of Ras-like GTPase activity (Roadblock/LC7/MglB family)